MNKNSKYQDTPLPKRWPISPGWVKLLGLIFLTAPFASQAQESLSLDECLRLVAVNYPLARQEALLEDQLKHDIEALEKGRLPQFDLTGQATYQSEVTSIPGQLPNISIDPPNKDQYRTTLDASQLLYHGGMIDASVKAKTTQNAIEKQEVAVTLYALKNRVNTLFFSLLLLQENQALLKAKANQLQTRLSEVKAGVRFGALLPAAADALEVELLKIEQQHAELDFTWVGLLRQLSLLTGKELDPRSKLIHPEGLEAAARQVATRPEHKLFELQMSQIDLSTELLAKSNLPKISAFAQGGYGNPGLNMLDNSFKSFYTTGVRLNWKVFDWHKNRKEQQALQINKDKIDSQREAFELGIDLELANLQAEIDKLEELIRYDQEIIPRFEKIVRIADSQLKNGVITSSAYITDFTNLYEAKQHLTLHKTQQLRNQIQYLITQGSYEKSTN